MFKSTLIKDFILLLKFFYRKINNFIYVFLVRSKLNYLINILCNFFLFRNQNLNHKSYPKNLEIQIKDIIKNEYKTINKEDFIKKKESCYFIPVNGFAEADIATCATLAKGLDILGHEVGILHCNSSLPACGWNVHGNNQLTKLTNNTLLSFINKERCNQCKNQIKQVCSLVGIDLINLSEFSEKKLIEHAKSYIDKNFKLEDIEKPIIVDGVNITEHAFSSTLRMLLKGEIDINNDYEVNLLKKFLISSYIHTKNLKNFIILKKPKHIICNHGIYIEHGIIVDLCKIYNIHVVIYNYPYRKNTILFSHDDTYHRTWLIEKNDRWENLDLSQDQKNKLKTYMDSKIAGGRDNVNFHPKPIIKKKEIYSKLNLNDEQKFDLLLTNTLWDAQIFFKSNIFKNMLDWIYKSIDFYKNNSKRKLLIRIHPGESKGSLSTNQPLYNEIIKKYKNNLGENIIIIKPEDDISTYTLIDNANMVLVYATKASLEIAYRGVPQIIAGEAIARNKGLGYDVNDLESYYAALKSGFIKDYNSNDIKIRAEKFCYHFFFIKMLDLDDLFEIGLSNFKQVNLKINSFDSIVETKVFKQFSEYLFND